MALARCVPTLRCEQLIVNAKSPLESGEETVLTFLPSTKNATEAIDVPDTEAFARFATVHWEVRSFAEPCTTGTDGSGAGAERAPAPPAAHRWGRAPRPRTPA